MRGNRYVGADGEGKEQRLLLAIFRHEANAVVNGVLWGRDADRLAVNDDLPGIEPVRAKNGASGFRPARADKPGDAQYLALAHLERHIVQFDGAGVRALAAARDVFDGKRGLALAHRTFRAASRVQARRPTMRRMICIECDAGNISRADMAPVTQHRVAVADLKNLFQAVRDENC